MTLIQNLITHLTSLQKTELIWLFIGFVGQFVFFLRFVVQWLASEKAKKSIIPESFWYLSLVGSAVVFSYAVYRKDPVFILAFSLNIFIYVRNLMLIKNHKAEEKN
jgi:lipid-A-disaccharide synthase-like uncharacterized protein